MYLIYLDGLDSLLEWLIPGAKDYPIALVIYIGILGIPIAIAFILVRMVWKVLCGRNRKG